VLFNSALHGIQMTCLWTLGLTSFPNTNVPRARWARDVWRRASQYQAADGTVLGWIMNQARSRAIDRLRFDQRKKRVQPGTGDPLPAAATASPDDVIAFKQQIEALRGALAVLTPDERQAIEAAFFSELTYAEVSVRLNQPLGTIKTRIRSGLHKLREALADGAHRP
jgi:RNA polymerase sigma-70 factor, ECF subfamily